MDPRPTAPDRPSNIIRPAWGDEAALAALDLQRIARQCGALARAKGFRTPEPRPVSSTILLVITELAEAYEELRKGEDERTVYYGEGGKPEGFPVEIADAIIRLLDMCDEWGLNIGLLVQEKLAYNATRGVRHGKRF